MNKAIYSVITVVSSIATGVGGYFLARHIYVKKGNAEVEAVKKQLSNYYRNISKKPKSPLDVKPEIKDKCASNPDPIINKTSIDDYKPKQMKDQHPYFTKPTQSETKITVISEEAAYKITDNPYRITVYNDMTIVDENEYEEMDLEAAYKHFGKDNLQNVYKSDNPIYVFNSDEHTVYKLAYSDESYYSKYGKATLTMNSDDHVELPDEEDPNEEKAFDPVYEEE